MFENSDDKLIKDIADNLAECKERLNELIKLRSDCWGVRKELALHDYRLSLELIKTMDQLIATYN